MCDQRALLDVADEEPEEDDELDEAEMLNEAIARTEEERVLFTQMDKSRKESEALAWAASGHTGKMFVLHSLILC
jgi:ATP-dependent helicase STH1/SNF2